MTWEIALGVLSIGGSLLGAGKQASAQKAEAAAQTKQIEAEAIRTEADAQEYEGRALQYEAAADEAKASAESKTFEAATIRQQAAKELEAGQAEAYDYRLEGDQAISKARAQMAASGVRLASENSLLITGDIAAETERGIFRILDASKTSAFRAEQQAHLTELAGESYRSAASSNLLAAEQSRKTKRTILQSADTIRGQKEDVTRAGAARASGTLISGATGAASTASGWF